MNLNRLKYIINSSNFQENLEEYILNEVNEENGISKTYNPFKQEEITRKMIVTLIIQCTLILSSMIYLLYNKEGGNT